MAIKSTFLFAAIFSIFPTTISSAQKQNTRVAPDFLQSLRICCATLDRCSNTIEQKTKSVDQATETINQVIKELEKQQKKSQPQ
jgi:hypothetical protein